MGEPIPNGTILRVQFDVAVPFDATEANIREWLAFAFAIRPDMSRDNPLCACDIEGQRDSLFVVTTGFVAARTPAQQKAE